jgi:hypothetical protein
MTQRTDLPLIGSSIIGDAPSPSEPDAREVELEKYKAVLDVLLAAYGEGAVGLEALGLAVKHIVQDFSEDGRRAWFGYAFERAFSIDRKRPKGKPPVATAYVQLVKDLVIAVNRAESAPRDVRARGVTAFERVADILRAARFTKDGEAVTAEQVRRWYEKPSRLKRKPS